MLINLSEVSLSQEVLQDFEARKQSHVTHALSAQAQSPAASGLEQIFLNHEALPEFDFNEISIQSQFLKHTLVTPFYVSSMTAGHKDAVTINLHLAQAAQECGWLMGVGSQRRELYDSSATLEWQQIRQHAPDVQMIGNIGIAQVITSSTQAIQSLVDHLEAKALFIHLNPLQEVLQREGTPQFKRGLAAIKNIVNTLSVPVIIKEVGCGISAQTAQRLFDVGVWGVDVAGLGGTHWGLIEGLRANDQLTPSMHYQASLTFAQWGKPLVNSLLEVKSLCANKQVWASGGVRSGLDAAKLMALGADRVGFAKPLLEKAMISVEAVVELMRRYEFEMKIAMFCSGAKNLKELDMTKVENGPRLIKEGLCRLQKTIV